jgi:hypothetical protein
MSNSWTLIRANIVFTKIYLSKCGKLNVTSLVLTSASKIIALKFFGSNNVTIFNVNNLSYVAKNFFSSTFVTPSIKL